MSGMEEEEFHKCGQPSESASLWCDCNTYARRVRRQLCRNRAIRVDFAIPTMCSLSGSSRTCQFDVANLRVGMIQAPEPGPLIMRYELMDFEWTAIRPFLPNEPRGVPRVNDRRVLNGIFWILRSGAPWRDLPEGLWALHDLLQPFVRWRTAGVWDCIMEALVRAYDGSVQMIDTYTTASSASAAASVSAGRAAWVVPPACSARRVARRRAR
jgi:transposase